VKKWNPCGESPSCVVTSTLTCVAPDAPTNLWIETQDAPGSDPQCRPAFAWNVVDNIHTYGMEVQRNGAPYKNLAALEVFDAQKGARPMWRETAPDEWSIVGWYWCSSSPIPDGTYRFRVRSHNGMCPPGSQDSAWSDWCTTTVYTVLGPPTTLLAPTGTISTVSFEEGWGCELAWTPVDNARSYYLEWSFAGFAPCKKRAYWKAWLEEQQDYWLGDDGNVRFAVPFEIPDGTQFVTVKARNCRNQVGSPSTVHPFVVDNAK
jgi:hypothetical protein